MSHEIFVVSEAERVAAREGSSSADVMGESAVQRTWWIQRGTLQEDGPVTWEILDSPIEYPGAGDRVTKLRRAAGAGVHRRRGRGREASAKNEHSPRVGLMRGTTGARADGVEEVGGPNTSEDAGERVAPDPAEQRRSVLTRASGENHGNASTLRNHVTGTFEGSTTSEERARREIPCVGASRGCASAGASVPPTAS